MCNLDCFKASLDDTLTKMDVENEQRGPILTKVADSIQAKQAASQKAANDAKKADPEAKKKAEAAAKEAQDKTRKAAEEKQKKAEDATKKAEKE